MVRELTVNEVSEASKMGPMFFSEAGLPGSFVPEIFTRKWTIIIENGMGFILGLFRNGVLSGVFGAVISEDLNDGKVVANECFWFVIPEARGRGFELLIAYEETARARGAARCSMIHLRSLQPEKLAELYIKRGYREIETSYFKELN